jgi:uncharacterized protein (DUF1800 family)
MMDQRMAVAWARFGLGRRGEETPPSDPVAWLHAQLAAPDPGPPGPSAADGLRALESDRINKPPPRDRQSGQIVRQELQAAVAWRITTTLPYRERLVAFWSNHFAVSLRAGAPVAVAGAFVREAIRPNITGKFGDMLLAVMRHPAMLIYLNNNQSVGPDSPAGQRRHLGLNENLARESLELHTLGPAAGYTQTDVTSYARILTGWSVEMRQEPVGFRFRLAAHEPGFHAVLGRTFPQGAAGGIEALSWLATHPATQRHLALKLARHFIADEPPPAVVQQIAATLRETGSDLGQVAWLLPRMQQAWQPGTKLRTPQDFAVAALRALDSPDLDGMNFLGTMNSLGQPLWSPPLPNGWPDDAASWSGPEAMLRRVDWSYALAGRAKDADPVAVAEASLGPLLRPATLDAVSRAGSRREALVLLFTSPEFQRR